MQRMELSNSEYLDLAMSAEKTSPPYVLLPHEQIAVDTAHQAGIDAFGGIIKDKVSVSGGDDWHDGAFRATDSAANIVSRTLSSIAPFKEAALVEYPDSDEERVTLGSRVSLTQNGFTELVDVVGFRKGYPKNVIDPNTNDEVSGISPESPMGYALLGKIAGSEVAYQGEGRSMLVTINRVDQTAVSEYFLSACGVQLKPIVA